MSAAAMNLPGTSAILLPVRAAALIVTAMEDIEETAATVAAHLGLTVEIAGSRAAALRLLGRRAYAVVLVDQILADADVEGADLLWKNAGLAIPLQMNFALAGSARLERELRAALARRQREQQLAAVAAVTELDAELKNAVTGFLLESGLALQEKNLPPEIENRLRRLAGIACQMRDRLGCGEPQTNTVVPLQAAHK
ncbi:MAG TPA: hypothetical protein VHX37_03985 [Acidobacteriaceae bacterium]|jgi:hypothetical protein|nr:hypothetical protein [Acidobacteriaceae bacterium]